MHDASLSFLLHLVVPQGFQDGSLVAEQIPPTQFGGVIIFAAPLSQVSGQGHIEFERRGFGRENGKAVLAHDQPKAASVVPLDMEGPDVVNVVQRSHRAGRHRVIRVFHLSELDAAALGVLLPHEFQPLLVDGFHLHSSHLHRLLTLALALLRVVLGKKIEEGGAFLALEIALAGNLPDFVGHKELTEGLVVVVALQIRVVAVFAGILDHVLAIAFGIFCSWD